MTTSEPKKILIFHSSGMGDWLMCSPVIKALKERNAVIDVFVGTPSTQTIVGLYPEIRRIFVSDVNGSKLSLMRELLKVCRTRYDAVLFTAGMNSKKAAQVAGLLRARQKIAMLHSAHSPLFLTDTLALDPTKHRVENNLALLKPLGFTDFHVENLYFPFAAQSPAEKDVFIHPGGEKQLAYKRWPVSSYVELARRLLASNFSVSFALGGQETSMASAFESLGPHPNLQVLQNRPLREIAAHLQAHRLALTNDTGLGHLAAALNVPTLTLFGPANPKWVRPYQKQDTVLISNQQLPCRPCIRSDGRNGCVEQPCMTGISVDQVEAEVRLIIERNRNTPAITSRDVSCN